MLTLDIVSSKLYRAWLLDQATSFSATLHLANSTLSLPTFQQQVEAMKPERYSDSTLSQLAQLANEEDLPETIRKQTVCAKTILKELGAAGGLNHQALNSRALIVLRDARLGFMDFTRWAIRLAYKMEAGQDWRKLDYLWTQQVWDSIRSKADNSNLNAATVLTSIDRALHEFASDSTRNDDRIRALCRWYDLLDQFFGDAGIPSILHRFALALMNTQFCWPIQVVKRFASGDDACGGLIGIALPFFAWLNESSSSQRGNQKVFVHGRELGGYVVPSKTGANLHGFSNSVIQWDHSWHQAMRKGLEVGKSLWKSQNGRLDDAGKLAKLTAALAVDFSAADAVVRPHFTINNDIDRFILKDQSAEAYWVQVVLGLLLPASRTPMGLATGRVLEMRSGEYRLGDVIGLAEKLTHISRAGFLQKMILPRTPQTSKAIAGLFSNLDNQVASELRSDLLESSLCSTVRDSADALQSSGWRRAIFIGTPETRWAYGQLTRNQFELDDHEIREMPPFSSPFRKVWDQTQTAKGEIAGLRLANDRFAVLFKSRSTVSEKQLGYWLSDADHRVRSGDGSAVRPGPGLGVLCIRTHPDESDMRFWAAIFDSLEASEEIWQKFQFGTLEDSALALADLLNNFDANPSISRAPAPDFLVILDDVGASKHWDPRTHYPGDERGNLKLLLNTSEIQSRGRSHTLADELCQRDEGREHVLGRTRVLVVVDDKPKQFVNTWQSQPENGTGTWETDWVSALAVFRNGFSIHGARAVVNRYLQDKKQEPVSWLDFVNKLQGLVTKRKLFHGRGEYYFGNGMAAVGVADERPKFDAHLHEAAGVSFMPLVANAATPIASRRLEFSTHQIREATWHFRQVYAYAQDDAQKARARQYLAAVGFISTTADWDTVNQLLFDKRRFGGDSFTLACTLLERECNYGSIPHASRYAMAIEAGASSLANRPKIDEIHQRHGQLKNLVGMALPHCSGQSAVTFVQSEWAYHLFRLNRQASLPRVKRIWDVPSKLLPEIQATLAELERDVLRPKVNELFSMPAAFNTRTDFPLRHGWLEGHWNSGDIQEDRKFAMAACSTDIGPTVSSWLRLLALMYYPSREGERRQAVKIMMQVLHLWQYRVADKVAFGHRIRTALLPSHLKSKGSMQSDFKYATKNVAEWLAVDVIHPPQSSWLKSILHCLNIAKPS